MNTTKKHLLSICCLLVFGLLAVSSKVNKIHMGAFNYGNRVEDPRETRNYLLLNDGTKIYGDKVKWQSGLLLKDRISIDDQKYKIPEVRGYFSNGTFYGRLKGDYIKRIVHGKLSVYVQFSMVTTTSTDHSGFTHTSTREVAYHYYQRGEDGVLTGLGGQEDIKQAVAGCQLAVDMASLSNRQMRKAIKRNRNYLNNIFETYNNDCQALDDNESDVQPKKKK